MLNYTSLRAYIIMAHSIKINHIKNTRVKIVILNPVMIAVANI